VSVVAIDGSVGFVGRINRKRGFCYMLFREIGVCVPATGWKLRALGCQNHTVQTYCKA